ncbi:hypothetical protein CGLO_13464 [Colletotrichum gloeosporioides Cg-14]|uniref:Uncharacterized protein n=1 Tax=Colletotrichum gloeosporioides (strain Cg-14) TaxID=1237896 RepID=T0K644_COLGC|nr:hypothetical protein CGLO_13464 [Colletotrichum gloeosporioides Cg-14]
MSLNGEQTKPNQPQSGTLDERCRGTARRQQSTPLVVPTLEPSDGTPCEGGTIVYESRPPSSQESVVGEKEGQQQSKDAEAGCWPVVCPDSKALPCGCAAPRRKDRLEMPVLTTWTCIYGLAPTMEQTIKQVGGKWERLDTYAQWIGKPSNKL